MMNEMLRMGVFKQLKNPGADEMGDDILEFLKILGQPAVIRFDGVDATRTRAVVTLLHVMRLQVWRLFFAGYNQVKSLWLISFVLLHR